MAIRKGSLVKLDANVVTERAPYLAHLANENARWKVDGVTGEKGRYRAHIGSVSLPLDFLVAIPQKKGHATEAAR